MNNNGYDMTSGGLRSTFLSTDRKLPAGTKLTSFHLNPPFVISFVMCCCSLFSWYQFNDFSVKYFINSVAAVNAGLASGSLNNTFIGPSPK